MARFLAPRIEISSPTNIKGPTNICVPLLSVTVVIYESKIFQCNVENFKELKNSGFPNLHEVSWGPCQNFKICNFALKYFWPHYGNNQST